MLQAILSLISLTLLTTIVHLCSIIKVWIIDISKLRWVDRLKGNKLLLILYTVLLKMAARFICRLDVFYYHLININLVILISFILLPLKHLILIINDFGLFLFLILVWKLKRSLRLTQLIWIQHVVFFV